MKFLKSNFFKLTISVIFTVLCVYILMQLVDFNQLAEQITQLNPYFLVFSLISTCFSYYFRILRYEFVLKIKNNRAKIFSVSTLHYFFNKLLPVRSGEILFPFLLKKHLNFSLQTGIVALLFFRVLDFFAMIFLLFVVSFIVTTKYIPSVLITIFSFLALLIFVFVWTYLNVFLKIVYVFFKKIKHKKVQKIKRKIFEMLFFIKHYKKENSTKFILKLIVISLFNWFFIYLYYYFVVLAFSVDKTFFETLFAATISNFTFILPINAIGNVGPFEGAWAIGFYLIGVSKETSIPLGLFANIFTTLFTAVLAGVGFMILKSKK